MKKTKVIILGAAGRDFHHFNVVFRHDPQYTDTWMSDHSPDEEFDNRLRFLEPFCENGRRPYHLIP